MPNYSLAVPRSQKSNKILTVLGNKVLAFSVLRKPRLRKIFRTLPGL